VRTFSEHRDRSLGASCTIRRSSLCSRATWQHARTRRNTNTHQPAAAAGDVAEKKQPRLSRVPSMPALCEALRKAAYDPRISGLVLNLDLVSIGWAKAQELRRHIAFFRASGKASVAYMKRGGEKEYYLATACDEIYVPPTAQLSLRGLSVGSAFLRGVLDKVGVEPQARSLLVSGGGAVVCCTIVRCMRLRPLACKVTSAD
jgi:hypothetical protein